MSEGRPVERAERTRFHPGRSILLDFTQLPECRSSDNDRERSDLIFRALLAVDPSSLRISVGASDADREDLNSLIYSVGESALQGLLVVVLPAAESGKRLARLLTAPSHICMITLEQVHQTADTFIAHPVHNALALADRHARRDGLSVLAVEPPEVMSAFSKMRIVAPEYADAELFQTLLGKRAFDFAPVAPAPVARHIDVMAVLRGCNEYAVDPQRIYGEWLHQEFETEEVSTAVLDLVGKALGVAGSHGEQEGGSRPFLPRSWQLTIGAIRLARRMAAWTLEGETFRCSVLLVDKELVGGLHVGQKLVLFSIFKLSSPIPFDFCNQKYVRESAESAQSDELFLIVNVTTGMLTDIAVLHDSGEQLSRHDRFARMARDSTLLLHIRAGFVEVYGHGVLELWHDGFRWHVRPFDILIEVLKEHFAPLPEDEFSASVKKITGAVASLMDQQQGSTIVLLHEHDDKTAGEKATKTFQTFAGTALRENLGELRSFRVRDFPLEPLTSILHLDGAHAISQRGFISFLARRIDVREEGDSLASLVASSTGTGTRAARWLSEKLLMSYVIRVSSSGFIKIFKKGSIYHGRPGATPGRSLFRRGPG